MNYQPMFYNGLDFFNSQNQPNTFHSQNTKLTKYFQRYLLQKVMSVIECNNIPEDWDESYFWYVLLTMGFISIIDTPEFGVIPQHCTLSGRNVFYQPANVIVTNPLLKEAITKRIGEECALIKMQPDYGGCWDLVSYYADMLAITSESIGINIINSKLAMVFGANNKASGEAFKKMYDRLSSGEPAVFIDNKLMKQDGTPNWQTFIQNLGQNYIGDTLLADLKKIENEFCSMVGIPNSNFEKNAHLLESEVNSNNQDTVALLNVWLDSMNKGAEEANKLFGLNLHFKSRFEEELKEVAYLDESDNIDNGVE